MMYLVDANVVSEPTKASPESKVVDWLETHESDLFVDSIILGEIYAGILALPRGPKRKQLDEWFDTLVEIIECLPWDATIGKRWARLIVDLKEKGRTMPLLDSMIAATALEHDLTVATRNTRDFQKAGVKVFNPFA